MWPTGTDRRHAAAPNRRPPGAALIVVTMLVGVLSVFCLSAVQYLLSSLDSAGDAATETRTLCVAELARADAFAYIVEHPEATWPYSRGLTTVQDDKGAACGEYSYTITDFTLPEQNPRRRVSVRAYWPDQSNALVEYKMTSYIELSGGSVVVWEGTDADGKGVFAQRYDTDGAAQGGEFQVNTVTTGDQKKPAAAIAPDGSFVVAWEGQDADGKGVVAQRYGSNGVAKGGEFQVNTTTTGEQKRPAAAIAADESFVVVWEGEDADEHGVFARRYDSDGVAKGGEFQVNTTTKDEQKRPAVAIAADRRFVVVWEGTDADGKGVFGQRYDSDGVAQGGESQVNTTTTGDQKEPAVAIAADGRSVVVWQGDDADKEGVFAQRYDSDGVAQGGEFQVNTVTTGDQKKPAAAIAPDGSFVVVWEGDDAHERGVFARRYDSDGVAKGGEFQVNTTTTNDQDEPAAAIAADGSFVVVWEGEDTDGSGVFGQRYDPGGVAQGGEFRVNTTTTGDQKEPAVAMVAEWGTLSCAVSRVTDK